MSTQETIFQFFQKQNLGLDVELPVHKVGKIPLEGVVVSDDIGYGAKRISLADVNEWDVIELRVGFSIPDVDLLRLVPHHGDAEVSTRGLVSVTCSATKLRQGFDLEYDHHGRWTGTVTLSRNEVYGSVYLKPELVRTIESTEVSPTQAGFARALLATGPAAEIVVNRSSRSISSDIAWRWEDFSKSSNTWLAQRPDDVFFLELGEPPRLSLNLRWKSLQPILTNEAASGIQAALCKTYAAVIGQAAWTEMLTVAAFSVRKDLEDDMYGVPDGWKGILARQVATALYPDQDEQSALGALHSAVREPSAAAVLISKLGSLAHDRSDAGKFLDSAARFIGQRRTVADQ